MLKKSNQTSLTLVRQHRSTGLQRRLRVHHQISRQSLQLDFPKDIAGNNFQKITKLP